jgi:hypothetical protein
MHDVLGADQGAKHRAPEISDDVARLMADLELNEVYKTKGRLFKNPVDKPVPDVISKGLNSLAGPLQEYNRAFEQLRTRLHRPPVVGRRATQVVPLPHSESPNEAGVSSADESDTESERSHRSVSSKDEFDGISATQETELGRVMGMDGPDYEQLALESAADVAFDMDIDADLGGDDDFRFEWDREQGNYEDEGV